MQRTRQSRRTNVLHLTLPPRTGRESEVFSASAAPDAWNLIASSISAAILRAASRDRNPAAMNVRNHGAVGLDRFERGPINHVCAQALGGDEAGTLADDHADDVGAQDFAEMVLDSDARVANEDRLQQPVARRERARERAQQRRRRFSRPRRTKVRRRRIAAPSASPICRGCGRAASSCATRRASASIKTPAALGIAQVVFARRGLRMNFEQAVAPRPITRDSVMTASTARA